MLIFQKRWFRYLAGGIAGGLSVLLRISLIPLLGSNAPYIVIFQALIFISVMLGVGPGVVAGLVAIGGAETWLVPPPGFQLTWEVAGRAILIILSGAYLGFLGRSLRESREHFRTLASAVFDGMFIHVHGSILEVNDAFCRLTGYSRGELLNNMKFLHGLVAPESLAESFRHIEGRLEDPYEVIFFRKDGRRVITELRGQATLFKGRSARVTVARDITDRQQAQQELARHRERLETILNNTSDLCMGFDREWRFTFVNPSGERFFGRTAPEMVGKVLWEIFPQTLGSEIEKQMRRTMEERTVAHFNFLSVVQPGVWNEEEIYPTHEGIAVFARDITERRQAEDGLREANRHKDEFLAMLAHELRNPLAPIRNAVYSLNQQNAGDSGRQRQGQVIERQVGHMSRLLDDLLDVSRLTRGKITLHKCGVAVADVLNHAMEIVQPLAADRGQELLFTLPAPDVHVHGDPDRLTQAVGNLLTNAVKYTPEGGKIWLTAGQENNQAVVRVRDTGMGITPDILPYIFDLFTQEKRSLDRSQGGLGIGLTVVRNLVQLHGGTIEARSTGKGEGSEFIIRLPLLLDAPDRPCPEKHSSRQVLRARRRVLVVDDAEDAAESLAEVVSAWGHSVQIAHDGPSALEAVHAFQPEVVLLDIGLPGMNGYEVAREIRKEFSDSIELIALTGYGQATDRKESQAAGFHAHLVKPVDLDVLKQLVGTAA